MNVQIGKLPKTLLNVLSYCIVVVMQLFNFRLSLWAYEQLRGTITLHAPTSKLSVLIAVFASVSPLLASMSLVVHFRNARGRPFIFHGLALVTTLYYVLNSFLLLYRFSRGFPFDFYFLWYNLSDALVTLAAISDHFFLLLGLISLLTIIHYYGLMSSYRALAKLTIPAKNGLLLAFVAMLVITQVFVGNGIGNMVEALLSPKSEAQIIYERFYQDSIDRNKTNRRVLPKRTTNQNLFMIHLESLNAELVNEMITPRFLKLSRRNGILFPRMQSSATLTMRAQESILCSILPSLGQSISQSKALSDGLVCLPQILKRVGFKTLYFYSFPDIHFGNTYNFAKWIGFDELHAADIMKPGDKLLKWGYAEDIFYQRVFEYLRQRKNEKLFAYIVVGATNHFPFYNAEKSAAFPNLQGQLPFQHPTNLRQRLSDTTNIQDHFFGEMYENLFDQEWGNNSNMIVFGDHSWPIEMHPENGSNDNGAYQENFVSSIAIFPAKAERNNSRLGKRVETLYSQLDILPTILEMYGIINLSYYGRSFFHELMNPTVTNYNGRCLVSAQPFSGKYFVIIKYPIKYIYNLTFGKVTAYNLQNDPNEMNPVNKGNIDDVSLRVLDRCLKSVQEKITTVRPGKDGTDWNEPLS